MDLTTVLQAVVLLAAGGVAAASVAGFFGAASPWLDYVAHFRPHLAVAALLVAAGAGLAFQMPHSILLALALAIVAGVNAAVMLAESRYRAERAHAPGSPQLTIAAMNVNFRNGRHALVDAWIRREQPDVLVVTEVDQGWVHTIEGLADLYPYRAIGTTKYVTMLSRRPWTSIEVIPGPRRQQGILLARFDLHGLPLSVIGAHPASPVKPGWVPARDAEIDVIARLARETAGPVAAMGDFNASPWSAPMRRLVRTSPLRYADLLATTWPSFVPRWLGIKIDHIMLGGGCSVVDYKVGPDVGSDHRPVAATIRCAGRHSP